MKRLSIAVLSLLAAVSLSAGEGLNNLPKPTQPRFTLADRHWPENVGEASVCLWQNDKMAVVTFTIDDNCQPDHDWWLQTAEQYGFTITWFVIVNRISERGGFFGTWDDFRKLHAAGHDIQSHTLAHLGDDALTLEQEYRDSITEIEKNIPGARVLALAYPGGRGVHQNDPELAARYYATARGTTGHMNTAADVDYMNTHSMSGVIQLDNPASSWANIRWLLEKPDVRQHANKWRGWYSIHYHGLNDAAKEAMQPGLQWLGENADDLWMGAFSDVARYGQQRDTARLEVKENTPDRIVISLECDMRPDWYDVPLTVKARVPGDWKEISASQDGREAPVTRLEREGNVYALVNLIPGRGDGVLALKE